MDVALIPATSVDAAAWLAWRQEPQGLAYNPVQDLSLDQLAVRLAACGSDPSDPSFSEYRWMIIAGGRKAGTVALVGVSRSMGYGEIAYQVAESHQGRGVGRAAVVSLVDLIFSRSDLRRLMAIIATDNIASRRLVESLGFQTEGVLRQHYIVGDNPTDEVIYGLLRADWEGPARQ